MNESTIEAQYNGNCEKKKRDLGLRYYDPGLLQVFLHSVNMKVVLFLQCYGRILKMTVLMGREYWRWSQRKGQPMIPAAKEK
ncbi:hypothetical protein [Paenibacillus amylolyticus]|uniref:hypothetical protein n=1 Tax=Paenibacillus amylolyticus TaxID=1451 RepID=UPI003EBE0F38